MSIILGTHDGAAGGLRPNKAIEPAGLSVAARLEGPYAGGSSPRR